MPAPAPAAVPAKIPTPPPIVTAPAPAAESDGGFDVAAFIAANPPSASEEDAAAPVAPDAALGDSETDAEKALLAGLDEPEAGNAEDAEEDADPDAEPAEETEPAAKGLDVKALEAAVKARNTEAFLAALGDAADDVLGTKAHKTLRITAREVKDSRAKLVQAAEQLKAAYGDPAAIREAAVKQDVDAVISGVEQFFGASWADFIKFVNAGLAGRPERLEAKAKVDREAVEARAKAEREQAEAQSTRQAQAIATLKSTITDVVKKQQPALAGVPQIADLVFDKMKAGFSKGVNTPAKALAAVMVDLRAQHAALTQAFGAPERKVAKQAPAPRETGKRGREQTEAEFIAEFLRDNRP